MFIRNAYASSQTIRIRHIASFLRMRLRIILHYKNKNVDKELQ